MDDEDNAVELFAMHENENVRVPSGKQSKKAKDILDTGKESGMSDKVLEFPPIDTETVSQVTSLHPQLIMEFLSNTTLTS